MPPAFLLSISEWQRESTVDLSVRRQSLDRKPTTLAAWRFNGKDDCHRQWLRVNLNGKLHLGLGSPGFGDEANTRRTWKLCTGCKILLPLGQSSINACITRTKASGRQKCPSPRRFRSSSPVPLRLANVKAVQSLQVRDSPVRRIVSENPKKKGEAQLKRIGTRKVTSVRRL